MAVKGTRVVIEVYGNSVHILSAALCKEFLQPAVVTSGIGKSKKICIGTRRFDSSIYRFHYSYPLIRCIVRVYLVINLKNRNFFMPRNHVHTKIHIGLQCLVISSGISRNFNPMLKNGINFYIIFCQQIARSVIRRIKHFSAAFLKHCLIPVGS